MNPDDILTSHPQDRVNILTCLGIEAELTPGDNVRLIASGLIVTREDILLVEGDKPPYRARVFREVVR